jgi:hypothetical protein
MKLTSNDILCASRAVRPNLDEYAEKYSDTKYPPAELERLRAAFGERRIRAGDIANAFYWKWGHWGKRNFPQRHKILMDKAEEIRPTFLARPATATPYETFKFWNQELGDGQEKRYITRSFLTHLQHPTQIAIIDQHNWRAMLHLLGKCRADLEFAQSPRDYEDLEALSYFVRALVDRLSVSTGCVDRFLMMYGRCLKRKEACA